MTFNNNFWLRDNTQLAYFHRCTGHVPNPGMGIVAMLVSDHMVPSATYQEFCDGHSVRPHYPTDDEISTLLKNPMIDQLYVRVGWSDVQRQEGKLEFSDLFKRALEVVRTSGKRWSLRVMQNSPTGPKGDYIPEFLQGKLPVIEVESGYNHEGKNILPMYTDQFLHYWGEMVRLLGEEFDNDPMLESVDVSGFGFWSEGHHYGHKIIRQDMGSGYGSQQEHEQAVAVIIDSFKSAFKKTPLALNLHMCDFEAGRQAVLDGMWCRRDSYYEYFKAYEAQYGLMRKPDAAFIFETVNAFPNEPRRNKDSNNRFSTQLEVPDLMCDFGCHYGLIGFNPQQANLTYEYMPEIYHSFAERVGYRIRPSVVWGAVASDNSQYMSIGLVNDGCVNVPGELLISAFCNGKRADLTVNGGEISGRMKIVDMPLPEDFNGKCILRAYLNTQKGALPIRWATDCADGRAPYDLTFDINLKPLDKADGQGYSI